MSLRSSITVPTLGEVQLPTGLFINNNWVRSSTGETFTTVDPSNGNKQLDFQHASSLDVDKAVAAARNAFNTTWGLNIEATERARLMFRLADVMERESDWLSALESFDSGKGIRMVKVGDLAAAVRCLRYYAGLADKLHGQAMTSYGKEKFVYTLHQPIGVCGQIIPWNFPTTNVSLMMWAWKIAPALAAGCTVVMKPSELTPITALAMCDLAVAAGFPSGVINVVPGLGTTTGEAIARHMDIDKIAFTGSTFTGRRISIAAAESNLKKVSLELGGKSPAIVFETADIEESASYVAAGYLGNSGQECSATTRLYVHESVYELFLSALKKRVEACAIGLPSDSATSFGPLISQAQMEKVLAYVESGKKEGARCVTGGQRWPQSNGGYWVEPTILADTTSSMQVVKEEIFGPVIVTCAFTTESEVIAAANDTPYGLAAAVFTNDARQAVRVCAALDAGTIWCNQTGSVSAGVPFGGFKQSGSGRELGTYGLEAYMQVKAVHQNLAQSAVWPF